MIMTAHFSGICRCGHRFFEDHHNAVMLSAKQLATLPAGTRPYVAQEWDSSRASPPPHSATTWIPFVCIAYSDQQHPKIDCNPFRFQRSSLDLYARILGNQELRRYRLS